MYIVLGENKRSLVTKRNWDVITKLWPALVKAQLLCEKPSVLKLFDDVIDKLHNDIETTEIKLVVSIACSLCNSVQHLTFQIHTTVSSSLKGTLHSKFTLDFLMAEKYVFLENFYNENDID